jgi:hypothetical protein
MADRRIGVERVLEFLLSRDQLHQRPLEIKIIIPP